jgi:di/tripeptidase
MAILKGHMLMVCKFGEQKGINTVKDKTIKELIEWSSGIIKRLSGSINTIYGGKEESRVERFKYYHNILYIWLKR